MLQPYTTADILTRVRRDGFLATSDENWGDDRILGIAHDVIVKTIAPALKTMKEGWFRTQGSITLVAGQVSYDYPEEAMWNGVEAMYLRRLSDGGIAGQLTRNEPSNAQLQPVTPAGNPNAFWTEDTQMTIFPAPTAGAVAAYNIQTHFYRRPAQLVTTSSVVTVTAVASLTFTLTTTTQPAYFTTNGPDIYTSGSPYVVDVWKRTLPRTRLYGSATCTAPSGTSLTFSGLTATQVAKISPGDIVSVRGTTIFPDLPPELHTLVCELTTATIKLAQGDQTYQAAVQNADKTTVAAIRGMSNRADGTPKKLSLYNAGTARTIVRPGYRRS